MLEVEGEAVEPEVVEEAEELVEEGEVAVVYEEEAVLEALLSQEYAIVLSHTPLSKVLLKLSQVLGIF